MFPMDAWFRLLGLLVLWISSSLDLADGGPVVCSGACIRNQLLLISFDGFRWDYLNRGITRNMNRFASEGGRAKYIVNPFATKTLPSHFTTVTGLFEESHGIVGTHMYDPELNETFYRDNVDTKWWSQRGQEPVWITNQKHGGRSAVINYPGMGVAFDGIRPNYEYAHFTRTVPFNDRIDELLTLFANGSINFAALYFGEPDLTGHHYGPESPQMNDTIRLCDRTVEHLMTQMDKKGLHEGVNVVITSDHGMASVDKSRTIYAEDYLNDTRYPHFTTEDDPVVGFWPRDDSHTLPLYEALKAAPHVTVYLKDAIPPEYHYRDNIRIAPIIAVADEGWILVAKNWDPWHLLYKGNHGYNNSLMNMHGIFVARGPSFKEGGSVHSFPSVDIYPLMCHLLGITPNPNNGTMEVVTELLMVQQNDNLMLYASIVLLAALLVTFVIWLCVREQYGIAYVPLNR